MKIKFLSVLMCFLFCLSLVGCGNKSLNAKISPKSFGEVVKKNPSSFIAAENEKYTLQWDKENKRVVFFDKERDVSWSYVPSEAQEVRYDADGYEIVNHPQIVSPINITVFNKTNQTFDKIIGHNGSVKKSTFSVTIYS